MKPQIQINNDILGELEYEPFIQQGTLVLIQGAYWVVKSIQPETGQATVYNMFTGLTIQYSLHALIPFHGTIILTQ
jgi:hypothetical protein